MRTIVAAIAIAFAAPACAGGVGRLMTNAGEIQQGMEEQRRVERTPDGGAVITTPRSRIVCSPTSGNPGFQVTNCVEMSDDGKHRNFTCTKDQGGVVKCE